MDRGTDRQTDKYYTKRKNGQADSRVGRQTYGQMNSLTDGQTKEKKCCNM